MDKASRKTFPFQYSPGKKLFHIVVKMSDAPGSYSAILNLLGSKVNLIGTTTYTLSDGTAIFSGFSESLDDTQTASGLKKVIMSSKAAKDAEVGEGHDGLLVDTFHIGLEVGGDPFMLFRREGLSHMFDHVVKILGSGGEALLFEEGKDLGRRNAHRMHDLIGKKRARDEAEYLSSYIGAQGWGRVTPAEGELKAGSNIQLEDCFECTGDMMYRKGCNFMRGYFTGSIEETYDMEVDVKETQCVSKGAKACEFTVTPQ